jgi:sigma-B regulation protein RsbU (phosphoserine phosphatase)
MSGFRASLMSQDAGTLGPEGLAERVNDFLHRSVESGKFVTAFLGFLEAASGRLVYANAGHNPPALLRADGRVEWLAAGGVVLGIMPGSRFESGEAVLEPGDLLALYTDGVTEGADAAHEMWGEERLVESLRRLSGRPCAEAAEALVREVRAFEGDTGPADDITVLLARRA